MEKLQPKITGYVGFQPYGVKPYPSLKPGQINVDDVYADSRIEVT